VDIRTHSFQSAVQSRVTKIYTRRIKKKNQTKSNQARVSFGFLSQSLALPIALAATIAGSGRLLLAHLLVTADNAAAHVVAASAHRAGPDGHGASWGCHVVLPGPDGFG
jgi:hypothetical protein